MTDVPERLVDLAAQQRDPAQLQPRLRAFHVPPYCRTEMGEMAVVSAIRGRPPLFVRPGPGDDQGAAHAWLSGGSNKDRLRVRGSNSDRSIRGRCDTRRARAAGFPSSRRPEYRSTWTPAIQARTGRLNRPRPIRLTTIHFSRNAGSRRSGPEGPAASIRTRPSRPCALPMFRRGFRSVRAIPGASTGIGRSLWAGCAQRSRSVPGRRRRAFRRRPPGARNGRDGRRNGVGRRSRSSDRSRSPNRRSLRREPELELERQESDFDVVVRDPTQKWVCG